MAKEDKLEVIADPPRPTNYSSDFLSLSAPLPLKTKLQGAVIETLQDPHSSLVAMAFTTQ